MLCVSGYDTLTEMIKTIAFDADDTLWHNEPLFTDTQQRFRELLAAYHDPEWIADRLYETEMRNLQHYGYGIKSFTLSMIETAIELTEGRIKGSEIQEIVAFAKSMLEAPVNLLEGVEETIRDLSTSYPLVIITKGDLFDQESKIARSGLGDLFSRVEVVTEKSRSTYEAIARKLELEPSEFVMVGDSLKSDVLPVIDLGGHAIHVPYQTVWKHEVVSEEMLRQYEFLRAESVRDVPGLVTQLSE